MKQNLIEKIAEFTVLTKAFAYKKGSLIIFSAPVSFSIVEVLETLIDDVSVKDIYLPIVAVAVCLIAYFLCWLVDSIFGIVASRFENKDNKDWFESNKAYSSIGKIGGVLLVNFIMILLVLFLAVFKSTMLSNFFLFITVLLNVLACSYEIHSVGENIKRRTGTKPKFLQFFDKITSLIEEKILFRLNEKL